MNAKNIIKHTSTALSLIAFVVLSAMVLAAYLAPPADADSLSHHAPLPDVPHPGVPVVNLTNDLSGFNQVSHIRTVYVEQITRGYSYVQYNTNAAQLIRNCRSPHMVTCVIPTSGRVILDDGSSIRMARWVR